MVKSFYRNLYFTIYDYIVNNLYDQFFKRKGIEVASDFKELLLKGLDGNWERYKELMSRDSFKCYLSKIDK